MELAEDLRSESQNYSLFLGINFYLWTQITIFVLSYKYNLCTRLRSGWPRRVEHDGDDGGVVCPQLAHVPSVQRRVHQPLRRVQPRVSALHK